MASAGKKSCWAFSALAMEPCNGHSRPTERKPSPLLLAIAMGKILDHGPDYRQRRIGRRVRTFDGDWRMRRRSDGTLFPALLAAGGPFADSVRAGRNGWILCGGGQNADLDPGDGQRDYRRLPTFAARVWVCVLAFMLSDTQSIYSSQVEGRSRSPAHRGRSCGSAGRRPRRTIDPARRAFLRLAPGDRLAVVIERLPRVRLSGPAGGRCRGSAAGNR